MNNRKCLQLLSILTLIISLIGACTKATTIPTSGSPNILLIIADDMGVDACPGYTEGSQKPIMPNLQSLASNGIIFDNVWAYPVCSPTRASILTGRYGYRTGVLNAEASSQISADEISIQAYLNQHSPTTYVTSIIGKWHLSSQDPTRPTDMGADYYAGLQGGGVGDYNSWQLTENGQSSLYTGYISTKFTDLAIDWIGQQSDPWFCWLAYNAPHTPFHLPPDSMHSQGSLPTDSSSIASNPFPYYLAMCESVDFEMGRLFDQIGQDQLNNTLIIFIGDNGTTGQVAQSPFTNNKSKGSLFQGGIHVPMVISGKGVSRMNVRENALVSSTDLFTTIAEIAGIDLNTYEDSYSFHSLLSNTGNKNRTYNYSETLNTTNTNKSGHTIRNDQFKLMILDSGQERMFDLINDPYEDTNLLNRTLDADQQSAYDELIAALANIRK